MKVRSFFSESFRAALPRLLLLLCLSLAVPMIPAAAAAEGGKTVVRVGWYESSFNRMDATGRRFGYAYEYQMKIAAYTGWQYEYVSDSWPQLLQMLISGEIDLMSDVSYTEERTQSMLFPSLPMGSEEYYLFVAAGNNEISSANPATLNGKKVGVNQGSVQAGYFREWAARQGVAAEVVEVNGSEAESQAMLNSGALDAYVTVDSFSVDAAGNEGQPMPVFRIGASDFYFAVNRQRPDLLAQLNTALSRIQEENRYYNQQLTDKHLVTSGANAFLTPEEKSWQESHGPIRVGYQDNYLAFCAMDPETGELTGALKDFLEDAGKSLMNARIDFEPMAFPTAEAAIQAMFRGEVDCVFPANLSPGDGENLGLFMTPPLMRTELFAVVRQAEQQLFTGYTHVVVAVNEGNPNYDGCLRDEFPNWHRVYYATTDDCLRAVARNVADCVLISSYRYNNIARQCEQLRLATVPVGTGLDYCFAVAAGSPELYSVLARVTALVPEASINSALSYYITEDAKSTLGDFVIEHAGLLAIIGGVILLTILALLLRSSRAARKAARLISATETDALTGLYSREYFLEYAGRMCQAHPDTPMDAVVLNIDRFHAVNALIGREFGDQVLRTLAAELRTVAKETDGIAGRFGADRFDLFCRPQQDYQGICNRLQQRINALEQGADIRLRMGVKPWQKGMEVVQLFDRARTACSMVRANSVKHLIVFDEEMQHQEDFEQRLLNDVHRALTAYEFEVYYQPQFDIQQTPPKLIGAEALVRWNHPELGLLSPNDFIPLMERNGKIGEVDRFVWAEAARQIARWRDFCGVTIPVSVNLSRMDVFDPALEGELEKLLSYNGLRADAIHLEVTESAYTGNAEQVIRVVDGLRRKGFVVEMDDFGTGYSSLSMLSAMPVDVLKMDRAFIQRIGENEKDAHLVAAILGISRSLQIPVVAEGVETEEQLRLLKELGCDLVQGFFFSEPLPADEFEERMIRKARKAERRE